eukprot:7199782-Pyramimonas_sp.AAC.1
MTARMHSTPQRAEWPNKGQIADPPGGRRGGGVRIGAGPIYRPPPLRGGHSRGGQPLRHQDAAHPQGHRLQSDGADIKFKCLTARVHPVCGRRRSASRRWLTD